MSKDVLKNFEERNIWLTAIAHLYTIRVVNLIEFERIATSLDESDYYILEVETKEPIGVLRNTNFFFKLTHSNLENAEKEFKEHNIKAYYIRKFINKEVLKNFKPKYRPANVF